MAYFPYRPPFVLRSTSVRAPFNLRSSSVRAPFELRLTSVRAPFELRSTSVQPPFELRSGSVRAPFGLRSSSVQSPFELRSAIEDRSKNDRRNIGESSEAKRRCIEILTGSQGKGEPNKNFILRQMTFWNLYAIAIKKIFFPNKHCGSELILTFWNAINLQKNLESAFSCCNFVLASLLKHAPFWRVRIPISFRYHSDIIPISFRYHSDIIPKEHNTLFGAIY